MLALSMLPVTYISTLIKSVLSVQWIKPLRLADWTSSSSCTPIAQKGAPFKP
ncbi:hypothetical protein SAMD00019534_056800 [Acytostelium subglobosum LB1]|uniref:hypothetical protein n=1 Tax=Acytostelium subglobosum LB1 TaxID=1410327 RepID=UPI000644A0CC|nr:hypothetical protein SAMD00019534_056800 [Acytostelium subglobosum LB1]GAM22505.1 hypothetical protein SAMD00019534_056800 [Acytostelium subglobosum LB1]|eukprot:XP_012754625.1 hypothetical protein SAMD00019534_056800 [Acytostelium subglobosum LB1]